mmetsp:Transcript_29597/g.43872  ORF Transcript_29597/g.43872 Transcript_29597/m.43872 type:complete len:86 (+) Transcript_29597:30-287(+)
MVLHKTSNDDDAGNIAAFDGSSNGSSDERDDIGTSSSSFSSSSLRLLLFESVDSIGVTLNFTSGESGTGDESNQMSEHNMSSSRL